MKIPGLFLIIALAGCLGGTPDATSNCPSWQLGPDNYEPLLFWDAMDPGYYKEGRVIPQRSNYDGAIPNQLFMNFYWNQSRASSHEPHIIVVDAILHAYAYDNNTGERLWFKQGLERTQQLTFEHGYYTNFTVTLEFDHPDEPATLRPVRMDWELIPNIDQNPQTPSMAEVAYVGKIAYRVC